VKGVTIIAIYHLSIKIISRGKSHSAVAKAAYRAAECIKSKYDGKVNDYSRKKGVVFTEIMLPAHAPPKYANRGILWNAVEETERYKTAQLAREFEVALPKELTAEQQRELVREYVKRNFVDEGMCADVCIHDTGNGNPHAHIMLTMRALNQDGTWAAKSRNVNGMKVPTVDWNNRANSEIWRKDWARICNKYLEINDHADRIDHRSHKRRGLDELPGIHLGVAASQMEQKGIRTERGNRNREIADFNKELRQLKARIVKLQNWLDEDTKSLEQPMLYDTIQEVLFRKAKSGKSQHYQDIANVKAFADMLNFLQKNEISDVSDLNNKVKSMYQKQSDIRDELKPVERRLKVLTEHIKQGENFKNYKSVYEQYQSIEPGLVDKLFKREPKTEFYEKHRAKITLFEVADRYLKEHLNGKVKSPPMKKWRVEYAELSEKRDVIYRGYYSLKDEVKEVERVRRTVDEVLREKPQKKRMVHGLE
jgi:hypothetical protein